MHSPWPSSGRTAGRLARQPGRAPGGDRTDAAVQARTRASAPASARPAAHQPHRAMVARGRLPGKPAPAAHRRGKPADRRLPAQLHPLVAPPRGGSRRVPRLAAPTIALRSAADAVAPIANTRGGAARTKALAKRQVLARPAQRLGQTPKARNILWLAFRTVRSE